MIGRPGPVSPGPCQSWSWSWSWSLSVLVLLVLVLVLVSLLLVLVLVPVSPGPGPGPGPGPCQSWSWSLSVLVLVLLYNSVLAVTHGSVLRQEFDSLSFSVDSRLEADPAAVSGSVQTPPEQIWIHVHGFPGQGSCLSELPGEAVNTPCVHLLALLSCDAGGGGGGHLEQVMLAGCGAPPAAAAAAGSCWRVKQTHSASEHNAL
ncbi:uncharacterized protein V6R79_000910 [Siganus canaliculatus]